MKMPMQPTEKLTHDDLVWLYAATVEAFDRVKGIGRKHAGEIDGEVFTFVRRLASETGSPAIKQVFRGNMKHFPYRLESRIGSREKEVLVAMYDKLKHRRLADKASSPDVRELEIILLAAQASVREAGRIASESERVRKGLDGIQDILDGKEEVKA